MSAAARFELDASVRRAGGGRLLVGGTPPRLVRLSAAGSRALDSLLADDPEPSPAPGGRPLARSAQGGRPEARPAGQGSTADGGPGQASTAEATLAGRLERAGLLHPLPGDGNGEPAVTTIVPALDGGERLVALVRVLVEEGQVIVVDDGSRDGSGARAAVAGARVIRHEAPRGPAAARNAGLRAADTELVAFLDADCVGRPGWRRGLAAMLDAGRGATASERSEATAIRDADTGLALVAPRVRSATGDSALARYEEAASPLDLGPDGGLVGPDRRTAYVPTAALVARREVLLALGGFDESLRFGEDVDLVWRLLAADHRVRYVPSREVHHAPRPTLGAMLRQRAGYGASAPDLARRHGAAAAPLRVSPHTIAVWTVALVGCVRPLHDIDRQRTNAPLAAGLTAAALGGSAAIVSRRGRDRDSRLALAGLALRGHATATRHLARALVREWLPLGLLVATRSHRARRLLLAAAAVDLLAEGVPAGPRPFANQRGIATAVVLRPLDHAAYAFGLWRAAIARREAAALLPRLTSTRSRP